MEQKYRHILNFKDFKRLKKIQNIKDRYRIGRVLGEGSFGQVRIAEHRAAGIKCAVKLIPKHKVHEFQILKDLMMGELQILEDTSHPNILQLYELLHDDNFYYIISEFVRFGELFDFISKRSESNMGALTEYETKTIVRQLFYALNYMHKLGMVHRDIKPENILIDNPDKLQIKLTDFGFARYFKEKDKMDDQLGSPIYMPPEIVRKQNYNEKVDVWSTGVVTFVMLSGLIPFKGHSKPEVFNSIVNIEPDFGTPEWQFISSEAIDFIKLTLIKDFRKRPSAE